MQPPVFRNLEITECTRKMQQQRVVQIENTSKAEHIPRKGRMMHSNKKFANLGTLLVHACLPISPNKLQMNPNRLIDSMDSLDTWYVGNDIHGGDTTNMVASAHVFRMGSPLCMSAAHNVWVPHHALTTYPGSPPWIPWYPCNRLDYLNRLVY